MTMHAPETLTDLSLILIREQPAADTVILQQLLAAGPTVRIADTADDGMTLYEHELPDLVCISLNDHQHACSLARQLRERWGCRVHALILGGADDRIAWRQAFQSGAAAYLPGPIDSQELAATLEQLRQRLVACCELSSKLLETTRSTQLLDALPWGVILIGAGEQLLYSNRAALTLTGLPPGQSAQQLDDLFLLLYGVNRDANLLLLRTALHGGSPWQDTVFCGQNSMTLRLELLPLEQGDHPRSYRMLTLMNIGNFPTSQPYQTLLSAAAFDLLYHQQISRRDQLQLASSLVDGILPAAEPFALEPLLQELLQELQLSAALQMELADLAVQDWFVGQRGLLREILSSLLRWAAATAAGRGVSAGVSLQGREGERFCLRFSVTSVDRRLTRSSYQRGDELVTHQLANDGITALKGLRGIGLATTLASLLGSTLIVKSVAREGKTALFDLWLQRSSEAPAERATAADHQQEHTAVWEAVPFAQPVPEQFRILVAEDNPLEQANIRNQMQRLGLPVVVVGNGREAVEECEQNRFDLILMDILMPVMDGFEAVRLIREQERLQGNHTPIIALTSYSLQAVQERCARAGMNGYLPKPVTQAKLHELIASFAGQADSPAPAPKAPADSRTAELPPALDISQAMTNLSNDLSFYREMLALFEAHGKPLLDQIISALEQGGGSPGLQRDAHKLKGMAGNIGAEHLSALCMRIQDEKELSNPATSAGYLQQLVRARESLAAAIEHLDWQALKEQYGTPP